MSRPLTRIATCLAGLLALGTGTALADEPAARQAKVIRTKGEERTPATAINFAQAFGLHFDTLGTLGVRVEQATKAADPVGLAGLARELAVCERVSGKAAPLTSAMLAKQAVELAEARGYAAELRAVAEYSKDEATAKRLAKLGEAAERREAEAKQTSASGERSKGINNDLIVHNNTGWAIFVYEDGRCLGAVDPFGNARWFIGHGPNRNSVLNARSVDGSRVWDPKIIDGNPFNYDWHLN